MSLKHEFILISNPRRMNVNNLVIMRHEQTGLPEIDGVKQIDYIVIEDPFVGYLTDFFNWIPQENRNSDSNSYGLNYYGTTCFTNENSIQLSELYLALKGLFDFAPRAISLKGDFCWNDEDFESGTYEELIFTKKEIIEKLERIASWNEELKLDNNKQIIHLGI